MAKSNASRKDAIGGFRYQTPNRAKKADKFDIDNYVAGPEAKKVQTIEVKPPSPDSAEAPQAPAAAPLYNLQSTVASTVRLANPTTSGSRAATVATPQPRQVQTQTFDFQGAILRGFGRIT